MPSYRVSTGRGGAGNIQSSKSKVAPTFIKQGSQTPNILQPIYSTGRGGAGNMRKNIDPKMTRLAQDVDEDTISSILDIDESVVQSRNHHSDNDYINPIISSTENYITNSLSNALSLISPHHSHESNDSDVITQPTTSKKLRTQQKKQKQKQKQKQTPFIIIGRGGAGNIVSPASSSSKSSKSLKESSDSKLKQNNIQNKQKKNSFMSFFSNIFV